MAGTSVSAPKVLRARRRGVREAHRPVPPGGYLEHVSATEVRLKGTRIGIEHVLERYLLRGELPGEIAADLGLSEAQVYAIIAYLRDDRRRAWRYLQEFLEWRAKQERGLAVRQAKRGLRDRLLRRL